MEVGASEWAEARATARTWVYERLALLSAVIWALGAFVLMVTIVPFVPRPQRYIAVACLLPLIPAAIPWLFYPWLAGVRARCVLRNGGRREQHPEGMA